MSTNYDGPSLSDLLNSRIDCEDMAIKLGLVRKGERGNFHSPHHPDKMPSLSCFRDRAGDSRWKDFSGGHEEKGRAVGLYMYVKQCDASTAVRDLSDMYSIKLPTAAAAPGAPQPERTLAEWIGAQCLADARNPAHREKLMAYLTGRGIAEKTVQLGLDKHTLGFSTWTSPKLAAGENGYGGDAAAFVVRAQDTGQVVAVDTRYLDPALNGGRKTGSQGDKENRPWTIDWRRFAAARRVYVVESAINALSIDSCNIPGVAALAVRGTATVENMNWRLLRGKQVVLAFDNDKPLAAGPLAGYCPGLKAAWAAHEALLALDVPTLMVDQEDWLDDEDEPQPINDLNDYLQLRGADGLAVALRKVEPWAIAGMRGKDAPGRPRVFLPFHDQQVYWRYRVRDDFTSYIDKYKKNEETGKEDYDFSNVCGFRVAGVSRVRIASAASMMSGDKDLSPNTLYSLSVQVPREPNKLLRRVVPDEGVHNVEIWKKFGPVFSPAGFSRMLNIMERAADIGSREAINFVGIAWKNGCPVVNEAADCYFTDPAQQCPYHNLQLPSGPVGDARRVVAAYQATFTHNGASQILVWALGAHLKAWLGYWPHFSFQAEKGTGKGILTKRLERTLGMTVFSRQMIQTEFRILGSVSYTSHPVGWGEFSANKPEVIARCMNTLQECYQYEFSTRGTEKREYLVSAPVLLVGEEVEAKTLQGKLVCNALTKAGRGPLMPHDLPVFPVRQWLDYLVGVSRVQMMELHAASIEAMQASCLANRDDAGAQRMLENYASVRTAWMLLCDFAGIDVNEGGFLRDLVAQMNKHIKETVSDRQPWVWIVDTLLSEIARGNYRYPFVFDKTDDDEPVLAVRTGHVMDHMAREQSLRMFFETLPVKSDRVFKAQLRNANVLALEDVERSCAGKRVGHMVALSLPALEQYGLHAVQPAGTSNGP